SFSGGREQVSGAASTRAVPFLFFGTKSAASGRGKNQRTFTWGSFCFRESSGAKRSPRRSTRRKAASASKESRKGSFARMHSRTSSQVIRKRDRRPFPRAQRVHADGRLVRIVPAPVHQDLRGAQRLLHVRDHQLRP